MWKGIMKYLILLLLTSSAFAQSALNQYSPRVYALTPSEQNEAKTINQKYLDLAKQDEAFRAGLRKKYNLDWYEYTIDYRYIVRGYFGYSNGSGFGQAFGQAFATNATNHTTPALESTSFVGSEIRGEILGYNSSPTLQTH